VSAETPGKRTLRRLHQSDSAGVALGVLKTGVAEPKRKTAATMSRADKPVILFNKLQMGHALSFSLPEYRKTN
jgi:hypothetical protein